MSIQAASSEERASELRREGAWRRPEGRRARHRHPSQGRVDSHPSRVLRKVLRPCVFTPAESSGGRNRSQGHGKGQRLEQAWFAAGTAQKAGGVGTQRKEGRQVGGGGEGL